jgi:hypothetical protein
MQRNRILTINKMRNNADQRTGDIQTKMWTNRTFQQGSTSGPVPWPTNTDDDNDDDYDDDDDGD